MQERNLCWQGKAMFSDVSDLKLYTVEPRLSGTRLSGLFLWSQFGHEYSLVTIKIRSRILFKTTALKSAVKCEGFLLPKSTRSAHARRN